MYISPTQIETFKDCNRKWGYRILDKIRAPTSSGAQYGLELHESLEKYLNTGEKSGRNDFDKFIRLAKQYFPKDEDEYYTEKKFTLRIEQNEEWQWLGKIDCIVCEDPFMVIDHKYTSDLRYIKSANELRTNIQANLYSYAVYRLWQLKKTFLNRWIYYHAVGREEIRRAKEVVPVEFEISFDSCSAFVNNLYEKYVKDMIFAHKEIGHATGLNQNFSSCKLYGGCPYLDVCKPNTKQRFKALMAQGEIKMANSRVVERLRKKRKEQEEQKENTKENRTTRERSLRTDRSTRTTRATRTTRTTRGKKPTELVEKSVNTEPKRSLKDRQKADGAKNINPEKSESEDNKTDITADREVAKLLYETTSPNTIITMFDCAPTKYEKNLKVVHLVEILSAINDDIVKEYEIKHYTELPIYDYQPLLANKLESWLQESVFSGVIIVNTKAMAAKAVIDILIKYSNMVVHAFS